MQWLNARYLASFILSVLTGFALTVDAYAGGRHAARFAIVLMTLNVIHALQHPWFCIRRELALYLAFIGYMLITLLWTEDFALGIGTVLLAANFALVMLLISALVTYHDLSAVFKGLVMGFVLGAFGYFITTRFPLAYPEDFSYNTMAGMYLFGLFITVACGWYLRARILPIGLGLLLMLHIAATASIKTNLGVALGVAVAGLMYFRDSLRLLLRNFILLVALVGVVAYAALSNEGLFERLQGGVARVSTGAELLANRQEEDKVGLSSREYWKNEGLKGWRRNPVLGYGVEAFRADYGITSHSTPIDLLYNAGIIGLGLFYGMFASLAWRVGRTRRFAMHGFRALTIGGLACYSFMSLSGTLYYDTFVAAFMALSVAVLARGDESFAQSRSSPLRSPALSADASSA